MQVVLIQDVKKLGKAGDVINVSDGFARNFLLARNLAKIANPAAIADLTSKKQRESQHESQKQHTLNKLFHTLEGQTLEFTAPGDKAGHLYAGLKESEILARISGGDKALQKLLKLVSHSPLKLAGVHELELEGPNQKRIKFKISITCQN